MVSADQFAENHLESNGVDVKRSKLEARSGVLTWKWILEFPDQLWNLVEMRECSTATALMEIPTLPPPAPPPEKHVFEMQVHSNSGGGDVAAKTKMVICDPSYMNPVETKVNWQSRPLHKHSSKRLFPKLLNEDDKFIGTGQIIITQKLQVLKNDVNATMVSWGQACHFPWTGTSLL